jgi:hypothetical protein
MTRGQSSGKDHSPPPLSTVLPPYVNGGCFTRADRLLSLLAPGSVYHRNAPEVIRLVRGDRERAGVGQTQRAPVAVDVPAYDGNCPQALRMREHLASCLAQDIVAGIVHGSIGTGEEVAYSDFDALVILREGVFADARRLAGVARRLDEARSIMIDFDPLQHHGWFVLAEHQLSEYRESYLPIEVLRRARTLFPTAGVGLAVTPARSDGDPREALRSLCRRLEDSLTRGAYPRNLFELKSLLSQVMLLPALYVHARDGRGVFKKESFAMARGDFPAQVWAVLDEVSELRARWAVPLSPVRRRLLQIRGPVTRRLARRFSPPIPPQMARGLDVDFYRRLLRLVLEFRHRSLRDRSAGP